jgi:SAM-dependent methyltransferase
MKILTRKQAEHKYGPANAVSKSQILKVFDLASIGQKDTFYDLGSGHGRVVRFAVTHTNVKKAIGIEQLETRFCRSVALAKKKLPKKQLEKLDFWCCDIEDYDTYDATVVYNGIEEDLDEISMYQKMFKNKPVKIVKRYLPLVGYLPVDANRDDKRSWFFLMRNPLKKYKTRSKRMWAREVTGECDATIDDVKNCLKIQMKRNEIHNTDIRVALENLETLIERRFD